MQFWLEQNAKLIGTTIQALEVQRMTLAPLRGMNLPMTEVAEALRRLRSLLRPRRQTGPKRPRAAPPRAVAPSRARARLRRLPSIPCSGGAR